MKWLYRIKYWALCLWRGKPHQTIGDDYLTRWWIIPRNPLLNIYLHKYTGNDPGEHPHCHPWASISFCLTGSYKEEVYYELDDIDKVEGSPWEWEMIGHRVISASFKPYYREARHIHRQRYREECWTLFITGPKYRKWGFYPGGNFVFWKDYLGINDDRDYEEHGRNRPTA